MSTMRGLMFNKRPEETTGEARSRGQERAGAEDRRRKEQSRGKEQRTGEARSRGQERAGAEDRRGQEQRKR